MVLLVWQLFSGVMTHKLITEFHHNMNSIAVIMSDRQERELRTRWAFMKSRADFIEIHSEMSRIASGAGRTLAKPVE